MKKLILIAGMAVSFAAFSQSFSEPLALAHLPIEALAPGFRNPLAFTGNPAAWAGAARWQSAVAGEQRLGVRALTAQKAAAVLPAAGGTAGFAVAAGGNGTWREWAASLGYARALGDAAAGVSFQYLGGGAAPSSLSAVRATAAFTLRLSPAVQAGATLRQHIGMGQPKQEPRQAPRYSAALAWEAPAQWCVAAGISANNDAPPAPVLGVACRPAPRLLVRAGIDAGVRGCYLGAGVTVHGFSIETSVLLHRELGPTPSLILVYPSN